MARDDEYALEAVERVRTEDRDGAQKALAEAIAAAQRAREICALARERLNAHDTETESRQRVALTHQATSASALRYLAEYRAARAIRRDELALVAADAERTAREAELHERTRRDALIEAEHELQKLEKHRERWAQARAVVASRRRD